MTSVMGIAVKFVSPEQEFEISYCQEGTTERDHVEASTKIDQVDAWAFRYAPKNIYF